jgi:type IV secretory pathway component VirB8
MFGKKSSPIPNTPVIATSDPARKFAEIYGSATTNSSRWFVIAFLELVIIGVLCFVLLTMLPLKKTEVFIVETNAEKVLVAKPFKAEEFKPDARFVKAEATTDVRNLMTIDPYLTRGNFEKAMERSNDKAVAKVKEIIVTDQPFERLAKQPGLVREVNVSSVDTSQPGLIFVTATTNERLNTNAPIAENWRFTLHYKTSPPESEAELMNNPLGIRFVYFERFKESAR